MVNKNKVNYCQCGFAIKEMDDTLFDVERHIKESSNEYTEQEWVNVLEKVRRVQMAIKSTENVCDIKFKEAKESAYRLESLLTDIHTEKGRKDVLNRIDKINSEIYRDLDNCADRLRIKMI